MLGCLLSALAFPPAPPHRLYGLVRDEMGHPINLDSAAVILKATTGTQLRTSVMPRTEPGVNYELVVDLDSGIAPDLYKPTALRPTVPFTIEVQIGQTRYVPLQMHGNYQTLGQPAKETRLDLTLGEDSDGDGLPDAWERMLLALSGSPLTIQDLRPGDDFDGDGLSNAAEYLAGTYAYDPQDAFDLTILNTTEGKAQLEFLVIIGRTYTVLASTDLEQWSKVPFRIPAEGPHAPTRENFYATDVRILRVEVPASADPSTKRFYRLELR